MVLLHQLNFVQKITARTIDEQLESAGDKVFLLHQILAFVRVRRLACINLPLRQKNFQLHSSHLSF